MKNAKKNAQWHEVSRQKISNPFLQVADKEAGKEAGKVAGKVTGKVADKVADKVAVRAADKNEWS